MRISSFCFSLAGVFGSRVAGQAGRRFAWLLIIALPLAGASLVSLPSHAQDASAPAVSEAPAAGQDSAGQATAETSAPLPSQPAELAQPSAPAVKQTTVSLTPEQLKRIADGEALAQELGTRLDEIDRELLPEQELAEERLAQLRNLLRGERADLLQWQSDLLANSEPLRLKLADLGPAPQAEAPAEEASLAALRADLEALLAPFDSLATQLEALVMQIDRQLSVIAERRRDLFLANIFTPTPAIFSLEFWRVVPSVVADLSQATRSLVTFRLRAIATQLAHPGRTSSLLIFGLVMLLVLAAPHSLLRRYAQRRGWSLDATSSRAALFARGLEVLWPPVWLLLAVASFLLLYQTTLNLVASFSWLVMSLGAGLAAALLVLRLPDWLEGLGQHPTAGAYLRPDPNEADGAVQGKPPLAETLLLAGMTLLACLQLTVQGLIDIFAEPVEAEWLVVLVFAPLQIAGLAWLMRPRRYRQLYLRFFPWIFGAFPLRWVLRRAPWLGGIGLVLGFIALMGFVLPRLWLLLMALILAAGLRTSLYLWLDLGSQAGREEAGESPATSSAEDTTSGSETASDIRRFWRVLAVNAGLLLIGVPLGLMLLGYDAWALLDWLDRLAQPLSLGSLQLSPFNLALGVGLFALAWMAVRYIKVVMAEQVLPRTNLMADVRHSLVTLLGYVGFTIAGLVGLGVAGLDLSRFALIAGALSVGIGFGLQAIVSNFVSGLILLFERPVKLGDWVVLSSGEGIVKRISIRATEIETFDGRAIMVPNSELITAPVANWTHRSHKGRVMISVGVAYESDPKQVEAILYKVANNNPLVLRAPAPVVYLANFGDSSLDFQLRVHIADIFNVLTVSHQIRLAIFEAFQEQGISIPFPQQELRIKTEVEGIQVASPVFQVEAGRAAAKQGSKEGPKEDDRG